MGVSLHTYTHMWKVDVEVASYRGVLVMSSHVNTTPDAEEKGLNLAHGSIDSRPRWMILLLWTPDEDGMSQWT